MARLSWLKRGLISYSYKGKVSPIMALTEEAELSIALSLHAANAHEVTLCFEMLSLIELHKTMMVLNVSFIDFMRDYG